MFASHLLRKLSSWISDHNIIGPEQAGFRPNKSTTDHCVVLSHLISKQVTQNKSQLYVAFLHLRLAFDSVDRDRQEKLENMELDKWLLELIHALHLNTCCQVKLSLQGGISVPISINKGVKQGCMFAPTLFNLFINDLAPFDMHCPKLGSVDIPLLLYADDMALTSCIKIKLRRLVNACIDYPTTNTP